MKNKFKGQCHTCKVFVSAGEGEYQGGYTFCSESIGKNEVPESLRNMFNAWGFSCLNELNRKAGTSFLNSSEVRHAMLIEPQATAPTVEEIAANKAASDLANKQIKAARRAELRKLKQANVCPRCMGARGSEAWRHSGWTCHRCFGTGKYTA